MNIKKLLIGGLSTILLAVFTVIPARAETLVSVSNLQPDYGAIGGGGVYSAYYGPLNGYVAVSPGTTAMYDGREAGIIKAGFNTSPADDEGLFGFKPSVTINDFAAETLTYDAENQTGVNPVWMTIEIDTGIADDRDDNTVYQFVPTTNPAGWNTFNAGAGLWQKWNNNDGDTTGNPLIPLSDVVTAHTGLNVVRTYLRLGMGETYYNGGTGTVAWVDKTTLGGVTYDFVVNPYAIPAECSEIEELSTPIVGTNGSEILNGTAGNDLIFARGGSDVVNGKGGADCIVGGDGSDSLHGQGGNDVILGGNGSDVINGNEGNDWLYGQEGSDSLKGGSGDDQMWGADGSDSLKGNGGDDSADGGNNSDACNAEVRTTCEA